MRGARIALLATVLMATPAAAVHSLDLRTATRVANHVRHREANNAFGMRERIGGAFKLTPSSCSPDYRTPRRMVCNYIATGVQADANGMRTRCSVDVTVRLHGLRRTTWTRRVRACALQSWPAP